jgi:DNA repair and recombination protein RAD54B
VLFVKPTDTQRRIFANVLRPDKLNSIINGSTARSLALITRLTKLSTSPSLLVGRAENNGGGDLEDDSIESIVLRETSKEGLGNHDSGMTC